MPNGYGVTRGGKPLPAGQRVVDRLPVPGAGGPRLVQAGIDGVRALAASAGIHVPPPTAASSSSGRSVLVWGAVGAAVLVVVLVAGLVLFRRRRSGVPSRSS